MFGYNPCIIEFLDYNFDTKEIVLFLIKIHVICVFKILVL